MQPLVLKIDFDQLLLTIKQCNIEQKMVIVKELQKDTYKVRLKKLFAKLKKNEISPFEVTQEVEIVREQRCK